MKKLIIVDTRTLVSLAKAGSAGLDVLLSEGVRPVILQDVIAEIENAGTPLATQAASRSRIISWAS